MKRLYYYLKILILILFINIVAITIINCQDTYRVILKDKGTSGIVTPGTPIFDSTVKLHTVRSIERRKKVLHKDSLFSIEDAPVFQPYIDSVKLAGAEIIHILRWNNYLVIKCDSATVEKIKKFGFVSNIFTTNSKSWKLDYNIRIENQNSSKSLLSVNEFNGCGVFDYGTSYLQSHLLNVQNLHKYGITGSGIIIGFIDAGFRWKDHPFFSRTNVLSEYDFVNNDFFYECRTRR